MMEQPCKPDCPERRGGCAVACSKWQEYEKARNAGYEERMRRKGLRQADTQAKAKRLEKQDKEAIFYRQWKRRGWQD